MAMQLNNVYGDELGSGAWSSKAQHEGNTFQDMK